MTCEQYLKALDEDRAAEDPSCTAHWKECAGCRAARAQWEEAQKEFAAMREEPAPPFLHTRIMAHVRAGQREGAPRGLLSRLLLSNRWATPVAALFLGALVGGLGVWQLLRPGTSLTAPLPSSASGSLDRLALDEAKSQLARPAQGERAKDEEAAAQKPTAPRALPEAPAPAGNLFQRKGEAPALAPPSADEQASGVSVGEIRMKASADSGAPGPSRAPAQPTNEPVGQERDALAMAPRSEEAAAEAAPVVCMIRPEGGGATKVIQIGADSAPPPGSPWTMVVQRGGAFYLLDASGKPLKPGMPLVNELAGLGLSPGRYSLRRVG
jgi:hypothetical protein